MTLIVCLLIKQCMYVIMCVHIKQMSFGASLGSIEFNHLVEIRIDYNYILLIKPILPHVQHGRFGRSLGFLYFGIQIF
jgi:hypothetical protein